MGIPIVIATNGYGTPVTEATNGFGTPVEVATNGYGIPVVIVASGGLPVVGSGGGGSGYDPASDSIFAGFTTPPTTARKALIDQVVLALKAAGVWAKLDALYCFAAADSQAAKVNWIAPGTFNATETLAPVFTADQGFTGASTKYLDSGFNPTTAPTPKYVRDSATVFGWSLTSTDIGSAFIGTNDAGTTTTILPRAGNVTYNAVTGTGAAFHQPANTDGSGLFAVNRADAANNIGYRNGATTGTSAVASAAPANATLVFLKRQAQYWTGTMAAGGFGSSLTATEHAALYNALANYMAGLTTIMVAESVAIFAGMTVPPTVERRRRINDAVVALKAGGVWAKLDALYAFAAADAQAAKLNWVAPGTYNATEIGAPTFTIDQGFTGAASKYLSTGFVPSSAPTPKWVQDSASMFGWSLTNLDVDGGIIGQTTGSGGPTIYPKFGGAAYYNLNQTSSDNEANPDATGLLTVSRTGAAAVSLYRNGALLEARGTASIPVAATSIIFLRRGAVDYWVGGQCSIGGFGSQLSAGEVTVLYEALLAYQAGIATDAIAASFTTPPTAARKSLIQTCVGALMRAGVWDKLDTLYMFAAADSQAAKINWVKPGTFNASEVSAPTFTADQGFTGGSPKYLDANFNATTAAGRWATGSATMFCWSVTNAAVSAALVSTDADTGFILPRQVGDTFNLRLHNNGVNDTGASTDSSGLWAVTRADTSNIQGYRNGATIGSLSASASAGTPTQLWFLRLAGASYWTGQIAAGGGGGNLTAAEQLALYNALNAYIAATKIFAAFTTPPTPARQTLIQNAVASLMTAGVWDKLDALYMFAAADSQAAKINWKNPGTYTASEVLAPTFTADRGYTGNGTSSYIDTGLDIATAGINYLASFNTVFGYSRSSGVFTRAMVSALGLQSLIAPRVAGDIAEYRSGHTTTAPTTPSTDGKGFWSVYRSASNRYDLYKDGAQVAGSTSSSTAIVAGNLVALRYSAQYWGGEIACLGVGGPIDATGQAALNSAMTTYLTGVGAA